MLPQKKYHTQRQVLAVRMFQSFAPLALSSNAVYRGCAIEQSVDTSSCKSSKIMLAAISCRVLSIVAIVVLLLHRWKSIKLVELDALVTRCANALENEDDADVERIQWKDTGSGPNMPFDALTAKACVDDDGVATRVIPNVGTGVVVCDKQARKAVRLLERHPKAKHMTDRQVSKRIFGTANSFVSSKT